jgi:dipeptidyl aminopeptidase/acylaminoacyl peptidase
MGDAPAGNHNPAKPRWSLRRFLVRFLRLLAFTLVMMVLLFWLLTPVMFVRATLYPARTPVRTDPATLPFPVEAVAVPAPDGVTLRGWFGYRARAVPVILFGHGYPATREQMIPYAAFLYDAGYNVLLLDWRAWGESGGDATTFGLRERDDVRATIDYLETRPDLDHPGRYGGLGVSLGAGLLLLAAADDHRLTAVVGDSIYPVVTPMFTQWNSIGLRFWPYRLAFAPTAEPAANLLLEGRLADLHPLGQAAAVSPGALLLVHAEHDRNGLTPLSGARQIFAAARAPKELWVSPLGDHAAVLSSNPVAYQRVVTAFFMKHLPPRGDGG